MISESVFKVLTDPEWKSFQQAGVFSGNDSDIKDGYIHLSKRLQLDHVIEKYYYDIKPVWVIEFADPRFLSSLKWEPASDGQLYPHLYGAALNYTDVKNFQKR